MSKTLIIAEKPSVAREIAAAIGGCRKKEDWLESDTLVITSGIGHLVTITSLEAERTGWGLDTLPIIPARFDLQAIPQTKAQFNLVSKLLKRADVATVVNACDAGREGELIFRLIVELADVQKPTKRMWIQSMTTESIREAYKTMRPGTEFDRLSDAARSRSEADWLIGINGSRGISRLYEQQTRHRDVMSVGRVQTPTLAILVHREQEIANFTPKDFWEIQGVFATKAGNYTAKWVRGQQEGDKNEEGNRFYSHSEAQAIVNTCQGNNPSKVTDESKPTQSAPPKLFDLTTLQREANKRFKFSAKKTLDIAQALYEKHKATSYPRTDASALPEDYVPKVQQTLAQFGGTEYESFAQKALQNNWVKPVKRIFDNSKISDHFAIIPTGVIPSGLDGDERKIYDMVVRRFIAVFYPPAQYSVTTRTTLVTGHIFKVSGKVLVSPGWLEVYGQDTPSDEEEGSKGAEKALCVLETNELVRTISIEAKAGKTQPPSRYTEATLLAAMEGAGKLIEDEALRELMKSEAKGLGTPATRAATIEGLLNTQGPQGKPKEPYVRREGKAQHLVPTAKGVGLVTFLEGNNIAALCSPQMTGEWEQKLAHIEKGTQTRRDFMSEIGQMTQHIVSSIKQRAARLPPVPANLPVAGSELNIKCPKCLNPMVSQDKVYECGQKCGFVVFKSISKRTLKEKELKVLLEQRKTPVLEGFISAKNGHKFSAALVLNEQNQLAFVFPEKTAGQGGQNNTERTPLGVKCPKCGGCIYAQGDEHPLFACEKGDFKIWRKIAGRTLSLHEAERLIEYGALSSLNGFKSKAGKPFSAGLRLSGDKVDFVFEG